jgi:SAM-dependent methyltransferase
MNPFVFGLSLVALGMLMLMIILVGYFLVEGTRTIPWVPTRRAMSRRMLELGGFKPGDRVLDPGSGDGSIVIEAACMGGEGIGIERLGLLVLYARLRARMKGVGPKVDFIQGDILRDPLPLADMVACYLLSEVNRQLEPRLRECMPPGTRVVSRDFTFPTLRKLKSQRFGGSDLHVYKI